MYRVERGMGLLQKSTLSIPTPRNWHTPSRRQSACARLYSSTTALPLASALSRLMPLTASSSELETRSKRTRRVLPAASWIGWNRPSYTLGRRSTK
jgi:hypothetical protein